VAELKNIVSSSTFPAVFGCSPTKGDPQLLNVIFGLILFNELGNQVFSASLALHTHAEGSVIVLITFWFGLRKYKRSESPLISIFYRDGLCYFVAISGEPHS
jgi:hypothetical protein